MSVPATRPLLYNVRDVMELCRCHRDRAFELMHAAGALRLGRSIRVRPEDLAEHLERLAEEARETVEENAQPPEPRLSVGEASPSGRLPGY